jgi:uncharacterized protein YabE (DUF348 family)
LQTSPTPGDWNALTRLQQSSSPALRLIVAGMLVTRIAAGSLAISSRRTVTLDVDGTAMTVNTMKSRVVDIVEGNGHSVSGRDTAVPAPPRRSSTACGSR